MQFSQLLLLGTVAGGTIFLGLPVAMLPVTPGRRAFLSSLSAGILVFLLIEIGYKAMEMVEGSAKLALSGGPIQEPLLFGGLLITGLTVGLLGLTWFEEKYMSKGGMDYAHPGHSKRLSLMIAIGIGLHNFSEGLVIGQEFASGAISMATLLVVGFAAHNATEGFGIAAPLKLKKVDWRYLAMLGFIGGAPTTLGTFLGAQVQMKGLELFFLALAAGSILYVVGELTHLGKLHCQHRSAMLGILAGFFIAFGSELFIEVGTVYVANHRPVTRTIEVEASEFKFVPDELVANEGDTVRFHVRNSGTVEHEFELQALGIEQSIPAGKEADVTTGPLKTGNYHLMCDMPGHLAAGMKGMLIVKAH